MSEDLASDTSHNTQSTRKKEEKEDFLKIVVPRPMKNTYVALQYKKYKHIPKYFQNHNFCIVKLTRDTTRRQNLFEINCNLHMQKVMLMFTMCCVMPAVMPMLAYVCMMMMDEKKTKNRLLVITPGCWLLQVQVLYDDAWCGTGNWYV